MLGTTIVIFLISVISVNSFSIPSPPSSRLFSSNICTLKQARTNKGISSSLCMSASPYEALVQKIFPGRGSSSTADGRSASSKTFTIAISGASGMVGSALVKSFQNDFQSVGNRPIEVKPLIRSKEGTDMSFTLDGEPISTALNGVDCVIHLAGENVASGSKSSIPALLGAWTEDKKEKILSSRQDSTKVLVDTISKLETPPSVFLCASAVGIYGYNTGDRTLDETWTLPGDGFLAKVTETWEGETSVLNRATKGKTRVINARLGVVLSKKGGILAKLLPIFSLGGGGILGDGTQYFSWITLDDVVSAMEYIIENPKLKGPINLVAPLPVTNSEFTKAFGSALGRPTIFPVPEVAVKGIFGEMGEEMLIGGQRVVPSKLLKSGFQFQDRTIQEALNRLL